MRCTENKQLIQCGWKKTGRRAQNMCTKSVCPLSEEALKARPALPPEPLQSG